MVKFHRTKSPIVVKKRSVVNSLSAIDVSIKPTGGSGKGSMKSSVFICLSRQFLGIESLVFSKFCHGVKNPYEVVCNRAGFSPPKKIGPKQ